MDMNSLPDGDDDDIFQIVLGAVDSDDEPTIVIDGNLCVDIGVSDNSIEFMYWNMGEICTYEFTNDVAAHSYLSLHSGNRVMIPRPEFLGRLEDIVHDRTHRDHVEMEFYKPLNVFVPGFHRGK